MPSVNQLPFVVIFLIVRKGVQATPRLLPGETEVAPERIMTARFREPAGRSLLGKYARRVVDNLEARRING